MTSKKIIVISALAALLLFNPVCAYVLKGPHILDLMIQNAGKAKSLEVRQTLILYGPDREVTHLEERLRYSFPDKFRSETIGSSVRQIYIKSGEKAVTIIDGKPSPNRENIFYNYKDIFLYRFRPVLNKKLKDLGVDTSVSSFGRFEEKRAYVIGAIYPDETASQIWFEKDSFTPIRWLMVHDRQTFGIIEARYIDWFEVKGVRYPGKIEFYHESKPVREIIVNNITVNPHFSEDIFHIDFVESQSIEDKREDIHEIRKTIEDFKKIYE